MPESYPVNWYQGEHDDWGKDVGGLFRQALAARQAKQLADAERARKAEQEQYERAEAEKDRERQRQADAWTLERMKLDKNKLDLDIKEHKFKQATEEAKMRLGAAAATPEAEAPLAPVNLPDETNPEMGGPPASQLQAPDTSPIQISGDVTPSGQPINLPVQYKEQVEADARKKGLLEAFIKRQGLAAPRPVSVPRGGTLVDPTSQQPIYTDTRPTSSETPKALTPAQESVIVQRLTTQWDKAGTTDRELQRQSSIMHGGLEAAKAGNMAAGSQAVLVTFQKILDPDSVVRESEYARSKEGQSLVRQLEGFKTKLEKGGAGLTPEALQEYVNLADKFVAGAGAYRKALKGRLQKTGKRYGIPDDIIFEEEMESEPAAPTPAASGVKVLSIKPVQ